VYTRPDTRKFAQLLHCCIGRGDFLTWQRGGVKEIRGSRSVSRTLAKEFISNWQDEIFPVEGAYPYKRDLHNLEFHLLDTGHFALEEDGDTIAKYIRQFLTS
jgi:pimeloyl-ACP methyl ester carboxylesterase